MQETPILKLRKPEPNDLVKLEDFNYNTEQMEVELGGHSTRADIHTKALTANKTIYVSPTGSDETGDGSEGKPYRTPTKAFTALPQNLGGFKPKVFIAQGVYNGFEINKFYNGVISLEIISDVVINGGIIIGSNVELNALKMTLNSSNAYVGILAVTSGKLEITTESNITINTVYDRSGIRAENGGKIHSGILGAVIGTITINNSYYAIDARYGGEIQLNNKLAGSGNQYGLISIGGIVQISTSTMISVTPIHEIMGGKVFGGNQIRNFKPELNIAGVTYAHQIGIYQTIGNLLVGEIRLIISNITTTDPQDKKVVIIGLPRTAMQKVHAPETATAYNLKGSGEISYPILIQCADLTMYLYSVLNNEYRQLKVSDLTNISEFVFKFTYFTEE